MIDPFEPNALPVNQVAGEIFGSRYGLFVDFWSDAQGHRALFDLLCCIDGTRSLAEYSGGARVGLRDGAADRPRTGRPWASVASYCTANRARAHTGALIGALAGGRLARFPRKKQRSALWAAPCDWEREHARCCRPLRGVA